MDQIQANSASFGKSLEWVPLLYISNGLHMCLSNNIRIVTNYVDFIKVEALERFNL